MCANRMERMHQYRILRKVLYAWRRLQSSHKLILQKLQISKSWSIKSQFYFVWKRSVDSRIQKRDLEYAALEQKQEQLKLIQAVKFHRLKTLSKALLGWKQWRYINWEQVKIQEAQEDRTKKMNLFLAQLQKKHEETQSMIKCDSHELAHSEMAKNLVRSKITTPIGKRVSTTSTSTPLIKSKVRKPMFSPKDHEIISSEL